MICPNLWFGKFISAERGQIDTAITGRRSNEQITEKIMEAIAGDRAGIYRAVHVRDRFPAYVRRFFHDRKHAAESAREGVL